MKYVCVTLVGRHKLYGMDLFFKHLGELNNPPSEFWVSTTKDIYDEFTQGYNLDIPIRHVHDPNDKGDDKIPSTTAAREELRREIMKSDYQWSMWLDNDILVPSGMTDKFLDHLEEYPDLLWVHSFHAYRLGDGKRKRHGLGSCYIHRDLLENIPFIECTVRDTGLGDDYLWIMIVNSFEGLGWIDTLHGPLFDVLHLRRDGTIVRMEEFT